MSFIFQQVENLKRRKKGSHPYIPDAINYDVAILDYHLNSMVIFFVGYALLQLPDFLVHSCHLLKEMIATLIGQKP